ncbi:hypothetical protein QE152_g4801 [Popillia japonica]|uniref:Uncharacterized protein n=1 Tax=Popillia japonica TaxID=7064 RepID=A0AAW1MWD7_POPJA
MEKQFIVFKYLKPKTDNSKLIQDFMKGYLQPNRKYYIMFDLEETYKQFCREYCKLFGQNGPEIIRCTKELEVVEDEEKRNELIKNHHEGKTNEGKTQRNNGNYFIFTKKILLEQDGHTRNKLHQ